MKKFLNKLKFVKLRDILHLFLFLFALPVALIKKLKRKDLWLVCDNGVEAADNGFVFFEYLRQNHPEQDCIFAVSKHSPDYQKVAALGETVNYGSFKHWVLYLTARVNISSQKGGKPNYAVCNLLEVYGFLKNNRVFLQHGIILTDIEFLYYKNTKMSLFTTSTAREYDYVNNNYGYPQGVVQLLGLPRFDKLHNLTTNKNQVLIMPTWREWLGTSSLTKNLAKNLKVFSESQYFKCYSELLNSKELACICEKYNLQVMFYLHRDAQRFVDCFKTDNPRVTVCKYPEHTVGDLLKSSAFLVTDYSSIQTDFAYMKKPLCYFQFDYDRYSKEHYHKAYFDYEKDGFGPVFNNADNLAHYIGKMAEQGFSNPQKYLTRINEFFTLYDTNNSERNFKAIKEKWS